MSVEVDNDSGKLIMMIKRFDKTGKMVMSSYENEIDVAIVTKAIDMAIKRLNPINDVPNI